MQSVYQQHKKDKNTKIELCSKISTS